MSSKKAADIDKAIPTIGNNRKVPESPKPKTLEVEVDATTLNVISKVRTFDQDASAFRSRIKTLKEQIKEEVENTDEYMAVVQLTEQLNTAKEELKRRLESNRQYITLLEELADEKLALTDAERNISDFLKGYYAETHEEQIELGTNDARAIVIKAKLGKQQAYQTNIFSKPPLNTNEGRKDLE